MSTKLDKMSKDFKQLAEFQERIQKLEEENKQLKTQLEDSISKFDIDIMSSSEEAICKTQLERLQSNSLQRELTLEEARKVEIYSKILIVLSEKMRSNKSISKDIKDDDLLALVNDKH